MAEQARLEDLDVAGGLESLERLLDQADDARLLGPGALDPSEHVRRVDGDGWVMPRDGRQVVQHQSVDVGRRTGDADGGMAALVHRWRVDTGNGGDIAMTPSSLTVGSRQGR